MSDRRYTILSTSKLPFERIHHFPVSVEIKVVLFIRIVPRPAIEIKPQILLYAEERLTVIFTSAHAVNAVTKCLDKIPDWKIYCVGKETGLAIEKWFGAGAIVQSADNARDLSEIIINDKINQAVFFCGGKRMDILPKNLMNHGLQPDEFIVYDTRLTPKHIDDQPDSILFFSPTAVRSFFSMNELSSETAVFAMGTTTALMLKQFTTNKIIISPVADKAFVFNMAVEYAATHPII
jgi:uroporphyrinogen-III synthase